MTRPDITLYAILDPRRCRGRPLDEMAVAAVSSGATLLQFRDKISDTKTLVERAISIRAAIAPHNVPLIINDRVDVALAAKADGVHLGQQDMPVEIARNLLGKDAIIGLSIKTFEEASEAPVELLDYAFVGGVFETRSKDNPNAIGVDGWVDRNTILKDRCCNLPVGAIAGIDRTNLGSLFDAGCDGIAVISALFMADDVTEATTRIAEIIRSIRSRVK